ncbi:coilin isoform X5 [Quercus robur]|uniref:coilin isoform X5 n=1 Tax=Quercus robur TaxID=38942 RepID=UPI002162B9A5|nr:coilin isoform X5 [Quercus robur]
MESVRVRLEFKQRHLLKKSQLKEGLKRSWFLLKPEIETISDLTTHLLHNFDLLRSCPNGLILFMDGFVLPPFESTCILKDKDIVCVRRKGDKVFDSIKAGDGVDSIVVVDEDVEEQGVVDGLKLLANEEFDKECDECDDCGHERKVSKKRKASRKLHSPKRKKSKVAATDNCLAVPEDDQTNVHAEDNGNLHHSGVLPKKRVKKDKSSKLPGERDKSSALGSNEKRNDTTKSTPNVKRFCQLQENGNESVNVSHGPGETKKQYQGQIVKKDDEQSPVKDKQKVSEEHEQPDEDSDEEGDVVPIVIRPGHIRFGRPSKDADPSVQQNEMPRENSQWNGITCKKKGQKWGIEKTASHKWNDRMSWNQESSDMRTSERKTPATNPIDFDKLSPYTSMPKEGDVIAYRLIELSSSWTPELSTFRVGKISRYYPESKRIFLVTVPEYPIDFEKIAEESEEEYGAQPAASLYGEDGSLKIDYSSLVDVRIVKHGNFNSGKAVMSEVNEVPVDNQTSVSGFGASNNNKETPAPTRENGEVNVWEEISQALDTKKAQLSQEDGWSREESSLKNGWSYRALRGSALGPTMARLRAQNGL